MLDLEYTEIDGLLYPNIETGMEEIENDLSKYGMECQPQSVQKAAFLFLI